MLKSSIWLDTVLLYIQLFYWLLTLERRKIWYVNFKVYCSHGTSTTSSFLERVYVLFANIYVLAIKKPFQMTGLVVLVLSFLHTLLMHKNWDKVTSNIFPWSLAELNRGLRAQCFSTPEDGPRMSSLFFQRSI